MHVILVPCHSFEDAQDETGTRPCVSIGSHTIIELDKAGHSVVVVDNLVNSNPESLRRVAKIIGKEIPFYEVDVRDKEALSYR